MPIASVADVAQAGTGHEPPGVVQRVVSPGQLAVSRGAREAHDPGQKPSETVAVRFTRLHAHGAATYRTGDVAYIPRQAAGHLVAVGACTAIDDNAAETHEPAGENQHG